MTEKNRMKAFELAKMVAEHYGVGIADIVGTGRGPERVAHARKVCFWLIRKSMGITMEKLGWLFGRTSGNVSKMIRDVEQEYEESRAFRDSVFLLWHPEIVGGLQG